jgi:hypothetical protein
VIAAGCDSHVNAVRTPMTANAFNDCSREMILDMVLVPGPGDGHEV